MSIDLLELPENILIGFFKQLTPRNLCLIRETCSSVYLFVENNRFAINCHLRPHSLWVRLLPREPEDEKDTQTVKINIFVMNHPVKWRYPRDVYEAAMHISNSRVVDVLDTYYQVSAMSFSAVVVDAKFSKRKESLSELERTSFVQFFQQLRVRCDWLCLYDMSPEDIPLFLPVIRFSNINFTLCDLTVSQLENLSIQHCHELSLFKVGEIPGSLKALTKLQILLLHFHCSMEADSVFIAFLQEIILDESTKGNLSHLQLKANTDDGVVDEYQCLSKLSPRIQFLCSFKARSLKDQREINICNVYKFPLKNEVLYIFRGKFVMGMYFLKENCRRNLFSSVTSHVLQYTAKVETPSSVFDDFMKAPKDGVAIQRYADVLCALME